MNVMMLLEMAHASFGDRVAVRDGDRTLTFSELYEGAGRLARALRGSGMAHVALLDVASAAVPLRLFASAWAGLPFVPLNYRLAGAELDRLLARVRPASLATDPERAAALSERDGIATTTCSEVFARAATGDVPANDWEMDPDRIALLLFTSGTTGEPKAAVLRHRHLVSYVLGTVEFMSASEDDAALVSVPPYHVAGMASILSSVYAGRRIVLLPAFDPAAWLRLARAEGVSHAFLVPTMLARIVAHLGDGGRADLPSLRALSYGGGKMPPSVIERAMALFPGTDFTNAYGLTETSSTIALLGPDEHRAAAASDDPAERRRLASVGRPLPTVEVEIRGPDGAPLPAGQHGEIHVRGEQVSGEYLGQGVRVGADGFFATRDGGHQDAAGYLFVAGRIDDVIVRGGENLSPGEIEDVLVGHDAVADAAVVGLPDVEWGEAVAAAVALAPGHEGDDALREALRERVRTTLRSNRVPATIAFCDSLPYNETGKLLRREVRQWLSTPDPPDRPS